MSLADLFKTLTDAIKDQKLNLTGALVGSAEIGNLIAIAWPDSRVMAIAKPEVTLSPDQTQVTVAGAVELAEVQAAPVLVSFTRAADRLVMLAAISMPPALKLTQLFKVLANDSLAALTVEHGQILISTDAWYDKGTDRLLERGMNLTGVMKPAASYGFLGVLLDKGTELPLAGPISDVALPLFAFGTATIEARLLDVPLPGMSLEFAMINVAGTDAEPVAAAETSLAAHLSVGGVNGKVTAFLPADAASLQLVAAFDQLTLTSFADLAVFIGAVNPFDALPAPVRDEIEKVTDAFSLRSITLDVSIAPPAFTCVELGVVVDLKGFQVFSIIPQLAITELDLRLQVNNAPNPPLLSYGATAVIEIGGNYDVLLGFQTQSTGGYMLSVVQAPGHKLKLTEILQTFLPALAGFPDFDVETFGLIILPDAKQYAFNAMISSDWAIIKTPQLILTEIDLQADYAAALKPPASGAIKGLFTLKVDDDPENDVLISLAAVKAAGGKGWTLAGSTGTDQIIPVGRLITAIATEFDADAKVPAFLEGLGVENLALDFNTEDKSFQFGAMVLMPFSDDIQLTLTVLLEVIPKPPEALLAQGAPANEIRFSGTMQLSKYQFDIVFDSKTEAATTLIAAYHPVAGQRQSVTLKDLLDAISPALSQDVPLDIAIDLKDVKFVMWKDAATNSLAFGLDVGIPIDLSHIPIIGDKLPAEMKLAITDLQGVYATLPFDKNTIGEVNALLPAQVVAFPSEGLIKGVNLTADVQVGDWKQHFILAGAKPAPTPTPTATRARVAHGAVAATADSSYKWIEVNKQVGIFQFDKLGAGYVDNRLSIAIDAAVALGPLTFTMEGLSVGTPMNAFDPVFGLNGLGLAFDKPPLSISGSFIRVRDPAPASYYGQVAVKMPKLSFSALGGWSPGADPASFFLYASIDVPLGGPPFLYVTGLAGGLGINRGLKLPTMDALPGYILLPNNAPTPEASPSATVDKILPQLQSYFVNKPGGYWVAAGIQFTSFEMVNAFALVTVSFGVDFQLGVLGSCAMSLPSGTAQPVAYLEVDLIASFTPATGLVAVEGRLTPQSYIFGGFVKVEGGFAFYLWFAKEHEGDFVISVGGYAPGYDKPMHYPVVPRMKLSFTVGPLNVTGAAYFALTPAMLMAGMTVNAVFEAGPIRAWLDAGIHVLIAWAPFHYEAGVYVSIGIVLDVGLFTLNLHFGADFNVWGPAFGGRAVVDLDIVSFTISFGAEREAPAPVGWANFKDNFLPKHGTTGGKPLPRARSAAAGAFQASANNIIKVQVKAGLLSTASPGFDGIVTPTDFQIDITTSIPANAAEWTTAGKTFAMKNSVARWTELDTTTGKPFLQLLPKQKTFSDTQVWQPVIDIGPMGKKDIGSLLLVSVRKHVEGDPEGQFGEAITDLMVNPTLTTSNTAMWRDQQIKSDPNLPRLLPETLVGLTLSPIPRKPNKVSDVPLIELLFARGNQTGYYEARAEVLPGYAITAAVDPKNLLTITMAGDHDAKIVNADWHLAALEDPWVASRRAGLAGALREAGFATFAADEIHLDQMARQKAMTDWPMVRQLGS